MKDKFVRWFQAKYPGMTLDGPTAIDAFAIWEQAWTSGMERMMDIYNGRVPDVTVAVRPVADIPRYSGTLVDSLTGKVERCEK